MAARVLVVWWDWMHVARALFRLAGIILGVVNGHMMKGGLMIVQ